ncbi:HIR complex subunit [Xylographa bjoerkii]|nr:HIR complex subunit [Xylographa bjoerkii]
MHFIRPIWLTHGGEKKDFEVYSCHISPDGSRLVTAAGDGHVRIWSTAAIYEAANPNSTEPRQLASMSYHSGTIHTVRFSSSGKFLASGADDKIVCVYTLDVNAPPHAATFGTNEAPPIENWRIFRRLIGHDNDVQDLGWSYDSSILVSVGLDSKVVVWSGHTFEKLKTISAHQSHVKGLTFDPANKYFATASDDRTVKIFRFTPPGPNSSAHDQMNNFTLEKTISAPFVASPLTTYFRRCSWSPDGNHIAAANAVNGPVSSVAIINRGSWDGDIHLIGHEGPVEVCAFSPRLFSKHPIESLPRGANGQPMSNLVTVIACAGQDKALSVWITSNPRPLLITQELAVKSISDLAWSPDGKNLFVTSLDGSITTVVFEEGELGYEVSMEENEKALAKFGGGRRGAGIVEGPEGLLLEDRSREGEIRGVEGRMGALMGDITGTTAPPTNGDVQSTRPNHSISNGVSAARNDQSGNRDESKQQDAKDPHAEKLERLKQRVTITKDGKKRIAPLLVSSSAAGESSLPRSQLMASMSNGAGTTNDGPKTILDLSKPFDGLPKGGLAALLLGNKRKLVPSEGDDEGHAQKKIAIASQNGATPILLNTLEGLAPANNKASDSGQLPTPEFIRPAIVNPSLLTSQVRLAVPKVRAHVISGISDKVDQGTQTQNSADQGVNGTSVSAARTDTVFEARNPIGPSPTGRQEDHEPARLAVTRRGQPIWQDFLPRSVLLLAGSSEFWAAACEDGTLYTWTPAGRRMMNAMVVESQPVIIESKNSWLLCITAVGMCYVWDVKNLSAPHPPVSLAPILDIATHSLQAQTTKAPAVTSARLNSEGRVVVTLTNGDGYAYSPSMFAWQRLSEVWWAVGSQYWNTADSSVGNLSSSAKQSEQYQAIGNVSAGVIPYLERQTTNETLVRGRAYFLQRLVKQLLPREGFEGFESSVSIAHLENRVAAALMLGAREEFKMYLYMYAKRLGAEGLKLKVEELLGGLLGGIYEEPLTDEELSTDPNLATEDRNWKNHTKRLCGWSRKELLKGVVLILGKHRDLQRITVPYSKILKITEDVTDHDHAMET